MTEQEPETQRTKRPVVTELEELIGKKFPVLDDGFIRLVGYMGGDRAVEQAARVSYGEGTRKVSKTRGLIRYLMRHRHTTPFEMCEIKFQVRVPMDTWRQWIRHRTANVNEYSTRYSVAIDASQKTAPDEWRKQSRSNRQGSEGFLDPEIGKELSRDEHELQEIARKVYEERLEAGVAREQARKDLPLSTYTEAYWKIDLHNLLHFLELRMDKHAQKEIRAYAMVIGEEIVSSWTPLVWEAFRDYRMHSFLVTRTDLEIISLLNEEGEEPAIEKALDLGYIRELKEDEEGTGPYKARREGRELVGKLHRLSLPVFWEDDVL